MSWFEWTDKSFRGLDLTTLKVDEAFFNITNLGNIDYYLYSLSADCVKCPFKKLKNIRRNNETVLKVDSTRTVEFRLFKTDHGKYVDPGANKAADGLHWSSQHEMGEFGVYDLVLKSSGATELKTAKEPVNTFSCNFY
jgi:heparan-alpha-glucosaminide N-acetyltransferase